jgi:hypothetical protein
LSPLGVSGIVNDMEKRTRILLYGRSLILEAVALELQQYPNLEIMAPIARPIAPPEWVALAPDVVLYDVQGARPEDSLALLGANPQLLLIGVDAGENHMLLLSGKQTHVLSIQDVVQAINTHGEL